MAKVTRTFGRRTAALEWVASMKAQFPGKVIGGSVASTGHEGSNAIAYVFGDITPEMAEQMKSKGRRNGRFEYKP